MKKDNSELKALLAKISFDETYFIKNDEMRGNTVAIFRQNKDTSISPKTEYMSRSELKAFLEGFIMGRKNSIGR